MSTFKENLKYRFDNMMSKGTVALMGILFAVTAVVILLAGSIASLLGGGSIGENIWQSVMHTIDAGTIAGHDIAATDATFIVLMCIVTLCGLFVTSILIGIITTGFEEKFNALKRGNSAVIERGHTLILGFNDAIHTFITELIAANENQKDACIVILTAHDKEEVEAAIAEMLPPHCNTRIVCRTGSITDATMISRCAITQAKSVIINSEDDFTITKAILAINAILSESANADLSKPHIVATVSNALNLEAANIAGEGNTELLLVNDIIARIIAQTCRQSGLSNVLIELFDYDGDEIYFESFPEATGKTFADAALRMPKSVAMGILRGERIMLNPDPQEVIIIGDRIIVLAEDDGTTTLAPTAKNTANLSALTSKTTAHTNTLDKLLILGVNSMLPLILQELNRFFVSGSTIVIADQSIPEEYKAMAADLENLNLIIKECDTNDRRNLNDLVSADTDRILLLSNEEADTEDSDAMTLMKLIHLRDIARRADRTINITSEIKNSTNQKLAKVAEVNDLVVGTNIVNLALTQISENRSLATLFRELLQSDGAEIYIRPAAEYVQLDTPMDFYAVTEIVSQRGECALGYKQQRGTHQVITTNPDKAAMITFTAADHIIVIATD